MSNNVVEIIVRAIDKTKSGLTSPIENLNDLQKNVAKLIPSFAALATAAAGAAIALTKSAINMQDEMGKAAQKAGVTVESFSTMAYAAGLAEVEQNKLVTSMARLAVQMTKNAADANETTDALDKMGISAKNADGSFKQTDAVMLEVADHFRGMADGVAKTTLAVKLFGKSGQDLIPFLNAGSEGIREMQDEAKRLGLEVGGTAGAADEFNDNLERMAAAGRGFWNQIATELLPGLVQLTDQIVEVITAGEGIGTIGLLLADIAGLVMDVVRGWLLLGEAIGKIPAAAAEFFSGNFAGASAIMNSIGQTKIKAPKFEGKTEGPDVGGVDEKELAKQEEAYARHLEKINASLVKASEDKQAILQAEYTREQDAITRDITNGTQRDELLAKAFEAFNARKLQIEKETSDKLEEKRREVFEKLRAETAAASLDEVDQAWEKHRQRMQMIAEAELADADFKAAKLESERLYTEAEKAILAEREADKMAVLEERARLQFESDLLAREMETQFTEHFMSESARRKMAIDQEYQARFLAIGQLRVSEEQSLDLLDKANKDSGAKKKAVNMDVLQNNLNIMATGAAAAAKFGKEGFIAAKGIAIAQAIINTYQGASKALAQGGIVGPVMAAIVIATGMAQVATIASTSPSGQAHAGMDFIPSEGSWMLDRGERVVQPEANKQLTNFLDQEEESAGQAGRGARGNASGNRAQLILDGRVIGEILFDMSRDGRLQIDKGAVTTS